MSRHFWDSTLDSSVAARGYVIQDRAGEAGVVDLSKIDFDALQKRFERGRKHTEAEKLKGTINAGLRRMVRLNRMRIDYLERFQQMIDEYNSGSVNIEEFFRRLTAFAMELNHEEQRAVSEGLSEEELAVFDLLTRPQMDLSDREIRIIKKVAREILSTLKTSKLVLDWRKRQQSRADVRVTIEQVLDQGLPPVYTSELFQQKASAIFQHVYESYFGAGTSIYATPE